MTAAFPPSSANQPLPKVCEVAFLFPFPANKPVELWDEPHKFPGQPVERNAATGWHHFVIQAAHCYCKNSTEHWLAVVFSSVFRICWTIFFVMGLAAIIIGGFVVICAGPLTNHKLYKVGGALQLLGGKAKYRIGGFFSNRSSEAFFRRRLSWEHFKVCREISDPQKKKLYNLLHL